MSRSIRSSRRASTERGFVLIAALVLAILYFALMELMLIDSSRALREAQRFRSRVIAATAAENGAELAAQQMVTRYGNKAEASDAQATVSGEYSRSMENFELKGEAVAKGAVQTRATVVLNGRVDEASGAIDIEYANHSH